MAGSSAGLRRLATALVVGAALLAGCSAGAPADASPVATDRVDMPRSYRFAPATITVPPGTTVTWTNSDQFSHSVRFGASGEPDLVLAPGETGTHDFAEPGTYAYVCTFHPTDMTGTVVVTAG